MCLLRTLRSYRICLTHRSATNSCLVSCQRGERAVTCCTVNLIGIVTYVNNRKNISPFCQLSVSQNVITALQMYGSFRAIESCSMKRAEAAGPTCAMWLVSDIVLFANCSSFIKATIFHLFDRCSQFCQQCHDLSRNTRPLRNLLGDNISNPNLSDLFLLCSKTAAFLCCTRNDFSSASSPLDLVECCKTCFSQLSCRYRLLIEINF